MATYLFSNLLTYRINASSPEEAVNTLLNEFESMSDDDLRDEIRDLLLSTEPTIEEK